MPSPLSDSALRKLHRWYLKNHREMPWRGVRDPYKIWVSEILLQQTQVETVRPYYERFISEFPTVDQLAAASIDRVLKMWEGCGYYARARNLHRAARLVSDMDSLPRTYKGLIGLPGIGPYTAAAISSIAFGEVVPVLDGNVKRVLARLLKETRVITDTRAEKNLSRAAGQLIGRATELNITAGDFNQAMMELGATLCKPRNPGCKRCPVAKECKACLTMADVTVLPKKAPSKILPHYDIGAAIVRKQGKILITRRPENGLLGGLWEFPGGKREKNESLKACVEREIREELGIEIAVGEPFAEVDHAYSHFRITLHSFDCKHISGRVKKIGVSDYKWVRPEELKNFAFPKADRVILEKIRNQKSESEI